ncbi:TIGR03751 family conjugal transfer lipoprotein [Yersinia enterocolitica]|uniref:Putative lipoprotein n=1 Tax=Yersinia enterocolitica TaxID=630 RepID=F2Q7Z9_YEREN|nr:putative lipoprotein [Yersinia enterocolitica]HDL7749453.1 TIGR03751 family conjugal transfer lipoprotein [Yersinia enterocolitica]
MTKKRIKLVSILLLLAACVLTGCSTRKDKMLPPGNSSMLDLWNKGASTSYAASEGRMTLRRTLNDRDRTNSVQVAESYSRTQENEIQQTFPRLPNPDMVMYVYPHLANGNTPVPGYSTVFPLYSQVQYALPGERIKDL